VLGTGAMVVGWVDNDDVWAPLGLEWNEAKAEAQRPKNVF